MGCTLVRVRTTEPIRSSPSNSGACEPRSLCGSSWVPIRRDLAGSDGRNVQQHAEMIGDSEASRVGQALAVAEQQVRPLGQGAQGGQRRRALTKGEEAGDVGEPQFRRDYDVVE